jgi:acyl-CoA reductase-like NAD-dependent aldehyde dehydrogenase
VPDGALNVLPGFGETAGAAISSHMDINKVIETTKDDLQAVLDDQNVDLY